MAEVEDYDNGAEGGAEFAEDEAAPEYLTGEPPAAQPRQAFSVPQVVGGAGVWGPPPGSTTEKFKDMPFQPFSKSDRLGKAADITGTAFQSRANRYQSMFGAGDAYAFYNEDDEQTFSMVHAKKKPGEGGPFQRRKWQNRTSRRDLFRARDDRRLAGMGTLQPLSKAAKNRDRDRARLERRWQRRWAGRQRPRWNQDQQEKLASVDVRASWKILDEIEFSKLAKKAAEVGAPTDLLTCGRMEYYDKAYDRVTVKASKLVQNTKRAHHNRSTTTTDDPNIRAFTKQANVFATDSILAAIMCCRRSVQSWDIVVNVFDTPDGKKIFFDKREESELDMCTVDETANVPPEDDDHPMNTPNRLSQEATYLNHVFSQQVLRQTEPPYKSATQFKEDHPFVVEDGEEQASVGYRYRKWDLGNGIQLLGRTEHDAAFSHKGKTGFMNIKALNEYKRDEKMNWRQKLDSQRGAVLATLLKNNACKIARWTIASMLAGSMRLQLGYISRASPQDASSHQILGTQAFKPRDLASQMSLNLKNGWAILKDLIKIVMKYEQGKYLLLKDPNKPVMRLYAVPPGTFDSEEEDSDEEEEGLGIKVDGDEGVNLTND